MSLREKTVKGVLWSAIQNIASPLISFAVFFILARLLDPESFGQIALATVAVGFLQLLLSGGFGSAIVQRKSLESQHLDTAFWVNVSAAIVLMTLIINFSGFISELYQNPGLEPIIQWLSITLLFDALTQVHISLLRRDMAFRSLAIRSMIAEPLGGVVGITMALLDFGVWSLVARNLVTGVCLLLILWIASDWRPGFKVSRKHFNDLFYFGASMVGTNIVNFFGRQSDTLLIGYFLGSTSLGYYNIAYRLITMMVTMIGGTINNVAWPLFSRLQNDIPRLRKTFYTATNIVSLLALPVFIGIIAIAPDMVPVIFGKKWMPSIPVLQILSGIGLLYSVLFFNESIIVSLGKPQWRMFLQIAIAITNVFVFFLVVNWGITAVAMAYVTIGYMFSPVSLWMVKRLIGIKFSVYGRQYIISMFASVAMFIIIFMIQTRFRTIWDGAGLLGLLIISGVLTYVLTVWWLSPTTVAQTKELIKEIKNKEKNHPNNVRG